MRSCLPDTFGDPGRSIPPGGSIIVAPHGPQNPPRSPVASRFLWFGTSLYIFLLGLELIRGGAMSLGNLLSPQGSPGALGAFGLGWLLACLFLSGSPVAALSLALLGGNEVNRDECFEMVMGSRIGASFVVLVIGFLYDLRSRRERGGVYVGALALLTTASVYLPALILGNLLLRHGIFDHLQFEWHGQLYKVIDLFCGAPLAFLRDLVSTPILQALLGILVLFSSFKLFDLALPTVDPTGGKLGRMATTIYRPPVAFLFGLVVTAVTLSVSVSLGLLVPLTVRGIVRRENLIPFILGANISTFIDTLVASLLVRNADAFPVVLCAALSVAVISLPIVFAAYRPYERLLDGAAAWITRKRLRLAVFVILLFAVPLSLILLPRLL